MKNSPTPNPSSLPQMRKTKTRVCDQISKKSGSPRFFFSYIVATTGTLHLVRDSPHDLLVEGHAHVIHEPLGREKPVRLQDSRHVLPTRGVSTRLLLSKLSLDVHERHRKGMSFCIFMPLIVSTAVSTLKDSKIGRRFMCATDFTNNLLNINHFCRPLTMCAFSGPKTY